MNTTARDMPRKCTDFHNDHINSPKNNMKPTSNTTKLMSHAYSQEELIAIAANVEAYRRNLREEYAWTDHHGNVHVEERMLRNTNNEWLHQIAKDLYIHGARKQNTKKLVALEVIGETICQEDPR